jgi:oxygen-dependent protoporphyrinogen oxidase
MKKIAIIGGGITGLTAAFALQKAGADVTVFEAGEVLGGPIRSHHENGYLAEAGPNTILETSPAITELIRELGIENKKRYTNEVASKRFIVKNSVPQALPMKPQDFLTSSFFSIGAKLRLAREPFVSKLSSNIEETVGEFVKRRLGQEFLDYAINPFVAGVYAGDPERLSVRYAFGKLAALEDKYGSLIKGQIQGAKERRKSGTTAKDKAKMFSFDDGLQVLIDALGAKLGHVRFHSAITKIERRVETSANIDITLASGERIDGFDKVLLSAPAHKIADIEFISYPATPSTNPLPLYGLHDIYYPPVTSLALGFDRREVKHPLDGFGMLVPKVEGFRILGTLFSSTLFAGRAPEDHVLLTTYVGGARYPELALLNDEDLLKLVLGDLRMLLGISAKPSFIHRTTWQKAIPQYEVGYGEFKDMMTNFEKDFPGIYLAGNFRNGISVGDCITNGIAITQKILL